MGTQTGRRHAGLPLRGLLTALTTVHAVGGLVRAAPSPQREPTTEFARLIVELSEEGGSFRSDNLISNELAYPDAVEGLLRLGIRGGTYVGVGPEQNFTYLAKVRPDWAFIADIRRDNTLQHLWYKALFAMAANRREFLGMLVSRAPPVAPGPEHEVAPATVDQLAADLDTAQPDMDACERTLRSATALIGDRFGFPLTDADCKTLRRVQEAFARWGLDSRYAYPGHATGAYPTLRELLLARDSKGVRAHFLASEEDFQFVKQLHAEDRVVPVTGDFAGPKALRRVGDWIRQRGSFVSAFYLSNVEQYLRGAQYVRFVENVRALPLGQRSVLVRCAFQRTETPSTTPSRRPTDGPWAQLLLIQWTRKFLELYDSGAYWKYEDLVQADYVDWKREGG